MDDAGTLHEPESTLADNIEFLALGPIVLYELEIQVPKCETAVHNLTWGDLKGGYRVGGPKRHVESDLEVIQW